MLEGTLKKGVIYMDGNYKLLEAAICEETGIKSPRCVYFGDNYIEDSIAPAILPNWRAITILPELYGIPVIYKM